MSELIVPMAILATILFAAYYGVARLNLALLKEAYPKATDEELAEKLKRTMTFNEYPTYALPYMPDPVAQGTPPTIPDSGRSSHPELLDKIVRTPLFYNQSGKRVHIKSFLRRFRNGSVEVMDDEGNVVRKKRKNVAGVIPA